MAEIQSNIRINVDTTSAVSSLKSLQGQISAFQTQMAKSGAASAAAARNMQQNLINNLNASGKFAATMTTVRSETEAFTHSLERNKFSMGEYFRYAGAATKSFGKLFGKEFDTINRVAESRVRSLQSQYITLGRDASGALNAIKVRPLALDMENLSTKTQIAAQRQQLLNQLLKQGSTQLLNWGKNTQWAGRQLMVGFTIPLLMFANTAEKAYKDMETASLMLRRVYGDLNTTEAETNAMAKSVENLAHQFTQYGIAVSDTMNIAAKIAATGKQGQDLLTQVNEVSRMAALGGVTQEQSLETVISLTNAFGIKSKDLADNINFLNFTQNQTVLSLQDMTEAIPKAAPVVQQLGGDVKDLAFFLTAMREGGISAAQGANAIKSGLASIINPSKQASDFLAKFNINLSGIVTSNKGNIKQTVIDLGNALNKLDPLNRAQAIEKLFGKFQFSRMSALLKNVTDANSQAATVANIAAKSKAELEILAERELKRVSDSPLMKFQKAQKEFQAALIPLGEQFMKSMMPIIKFFTDFIKGFNDLNKKSGGFLSNMVTWVAGIGPVILMGVGLVANAIANIIKLFAGMKAIFNRSQSKSSVLGETTHYMTQEQIDAAAATASLEQAHNKLTQAFTVERENLGLLINEYEVAIAAQNRLMGASQAAATRSAVPVAMAMPMVNPATAAATAVARASGLGGMKRGLPGYAKGIVRGPGTGTSDSIPAMISNGEAVIPAKNVAKYPGLVNGLIAGNIPGFAGGASLYGGQSVAMPGLAAFLPGNTANSFGFTKSLLTGADNSLLTARLVEASAAGAYVLDKANGLPGLTRLTDSLIKEYTQATEQYIPRIVNALKTTEASMAATGEDVSKIDFVVEKAAPQLETIFKEMTAAGGKAASAAQAMSQHMFYADEASMLAMGEQRYPGARYSNTRNKIESTQYRATKGSFYRASEKFVGSYGPARSPGETYAHLNSRKVQGPVYPYAGGALRMSDLGMQRKIVEALAQRAGIDAEIIMQQIGKSAVVGVKQGLTQAEKNEFAIASPSREEIYIAEQRRAGFEAGMKPAIQEEKVLGQQLGKATGASFFKGVAEVAKQPVVAKRALPAFMTNSNAPLTLANVNKSNAQTYVAPVPTQTQAMIANAKANLAREGVWLKEEWQAIINPMKTALSAAKGQITSDAILIEGSIKKAFATIVPETSAMGQAWSQLKSIMTVARGNFLTEWEYTKNEFLGKGKAIEGETASVGKSFLGLAKTMGITNRIVLDQLSKGNLGSVFTKKALGLLPKGDNLAVYGAQKTAWESLIAAIKNAGPNVKKFGDDVSAAMLRVSNSVKDVVGNTAVSIKSMAASMNPMTIAKNKYRSLIQQELESQMALAKGQKQTITSTIANTRLKASEARAIVEETAVAQRLTEQRIAELQAMLKAEPSLKQLIATLSGAGMSGMGAGTKGLGKWLFNKEIGNTGKMGVGMGLTMLPMMMSMSGNKQMQEVGSQLMMPAMAAGMALQMIPGPAGWVAAGLIAVFSAVNMFNEAMKKARQEGIKLADSMSMTDAKLVSLSKVYKTVGFTEARAKTERDALTAMKTNSKASSVAEQMLTTSEFGKGLMSGIKNQMSSGISQADISSNLANQLATAMMEGIITDEQAKAIANGIGKKLKNYKIAAEINGKLVSLVGLNGENLTNNPGQVANQITTSAMQTQQSNFNIAATLSQTAMSKDRGWENSWAFGSESLLPFIGAIGQNAVDTAEREKWASVAVESSSNMVQTNQQMIDSINGQFDALEKVKTKTSEINTLERLRNDALDKQTDLANQFYDTLVSQEKDLGQDKFVEGIQTSLEKRYKDDPLGLQAAQNSLEKAKGITDAKFRVVMETSLAAGMSPGTVDTLMRLGEKGGTQQARINLAIASQGTQKTDALIQMLGVAGATDGTISKTLSLATKSNSSWNDTIAAMSMINSMQTYGVTIDINSAVTDTKLWNSLIALSKLPAKISKKVAITQLTDAGLTADQIQTVKDNWDALKNSDGTINKTIITTLVTRGTSGILEDYLKANPAAAKNLSEGRITTAQATSDSLKWMGAQQKQISDAINAANPNTTDGSTGGSSPADLLKSTQEAQAASAFAAATAANGWGKDLSEALNSADKATREYYTDVKNGQIVLNDQGKALQKAFNAKIITDAKKALADYYAGMTQKKADLNTQISLQAKLIAMGMSANDAAQAAADSANVTAMQDAAIVDKKNKNTAETDKLLKSIVTSTREIKDLNEQILTAEQKQQKVIDDLQAKKDAASAKAGIPTMQAQINQYQDALNVLQPQEDAINKTYDERITALDKIANAQQAITDAQKDQLTIADAITKGDIAAAAKAIQDARAASANRAVSDQKTALDIAKQNQLDSLTVSINGKILTRKQIEKEIADIQAKIYDIQLRILSPLDLEIAKQQEILSLLKQQAEVKAATNKEVWEPPVLSADMKAKMAGNSSLAKAVNNALLTEEAFNAYNWGKAFPGSSIIMKSSGGLMNYLAPGGSPWAKGVDTIPAMLAPKEYVMRAAAVDKYGVGLMNEINAGTFRVPSYDIAPSMSDIAPTASQISAVDNSSVYNNTYSINVSTNATDADAVAREVMNKIRQHESQRVRGVRV